MKESYGEGIANHTDPELCGHAREDVVRSVDRGKCGLGIESRNNQVRSADASSVAWKAKPPAVAKASRKVDSAGSEAPCTH